MRRHLGVGLVLLASLVAAGCGGGGSSSGTSTTSVNNTVKKTGTFSLVLAGGTSPGIKHAWLTVYKVALNADADRPWDPADSTWTIITLPSPKTVDIASPSGFVVVDSSGGVAVPVGTYNQIRLFLSPHDDTSAPVATGGSAALTYKAQLDYEVGGSVPIEIPNVQSGLKLDRGVIIAADTLSPLTTRFDVDRSIVRFNGDLGAVDAITLRPRTYTYGFNPLTAAVISGTIDPTLVCGSLTADTAHCASDISVSLLAPSGDGTRFENWGTVLVKGQGLNSDNVLANDGSFSFVVGYADGDGNPKSYDLVIRGKNMKTMMIKNIVFSTFSNYLGCSWSTSAGDSTNASTTIRPLYDASPRTNVSLSAPLALKTGRVGLGFTLDGSSLPYEVYSANTDPFTGYLTAGASLTIPSVASGDVLVTDYSSIQSYCTAQGHTVPSDLALPFVSQTPVEGNGGFRSFSIGTFYTNANVATTSSTLYTSATGFAVGEPTPITGNTGSVNVLITGLPSAGANKAQLIVSDVGGIVLTRDIHSTCTTSPCTETVTLPAGTVANATATGVYEFAVRYWDGSTSTTAKSTIETGGTMRWARGSSFVNLRSATTGTASITVP